MGKVLFIVNAIVVAVLGAGLVFVPAATLTQFGTETRVPELHMARFLGAALIALGAKHASDEGVQRNLGFAMLGATVLALIVTIIGVTADGIIRNFGWIVIVVEFAFGLGYVFVLFLQPRMK